MARCGCQGTSCSCVITGPGVTGSGSEGNPYVISAIAALNVQDTPTINLTKSGLGTVASPLVISADATMNLDALTDVMSAAATTGQVLAKQADGQWKGVPPSTAAPGAIVTANGVEGDGSAGNPLSVKLPAGSGLVEGPTGLTVEGSGAWTAYTPVLTASGTPDPVVGNGTLSGRYTRTGKTVTVNVALTAGTTTSRGLGYWEVSLPFPTYEGDGMQYVGHLHVSVPGLGDFIGGCLMRGASILRSYTPYGTGRALQLSNSNPSTFPAGSRVFWSGTYEVA